MRTLFFCFAFLSATIGLAQRKAEGIYDSLNGNLKSMTVSFYNISKDSKGNYVSKLDYFSHHQEFIYDENNVLLLRNFYEDKKKIRESRDMVAYYKPDPSVKKDTSYASTDSSMEMLETTYRNGKITGYFKHIKLLNNSGTYYHIYQNADGSVNSYNMFVKTTDGLEKFRWQVFADAPLDLKAEPNQWEKYNEHGHLILKVYNMRDGTKKSTGRKYKYDDMNNAVWIQFSEWNPSTNKYEPTSETEISYKYRK